MLSLLACIAKILDKLEKSMIIDEVLPLLCEIRLTDLNILTTVLEMYRVMLSDRKYGLTMTVLATRVLPVLIPQVVNTQLDMETYITVQSTTQEMMDHIDRHQKNKTQYQQSKETMSIPDLVIRRPSVVQGPAPVLSRREPRLSVITSSNNSSGEME